MTMRTVLPTFRCASKEAGSHVSVRTGRSHLVLRLAVVRDLSTLQTNSRGGACDFLASAAFDTTGTFDYTTPARRRWSIFRVERCRQSGSLHFHHSSNNDSAQQYISRHNAGIVFFRNHAHNMLHVLPAPVPWPSQAGLRFCCTTRQCLVTTTLVVGGEIRHRGRRCCVRIE